MNLLTNASSWVVISFSVLGGKGWVRCYRRGSDSSGSNINSSFESKRRVMVKAAISPSAYLRIDHLPSHKLYIPALLRRISYHSQALPESPSSGEYQRSVRLRTRARFGDHLLGRIRMSYDSRAVGGSENRAQLRVLIRRIARQGWP